VGPYHSEGLLDAKMQRRRMRSVTWPLRARRRLASELSVCASPSFTDRQVSRAALRNSCSSCSEEL
jgi:hypothetical protein